MSDASTPVAPSRARAPRPRPHAGHPISRRFIVLVGMIITVACLYLAREVAIPLAMAILLAFLLTPLVTLVRRTGLPRVPAAIIVGVFALLVAGGLGWGLTAQIAALADDLPRYRATITRKVQDIQKARQGGTLEKVEETAKDVMKQIEKSGPPDAGAEKPVPVVVAQPSAVWTLQSLVRPLGSAFMVIVLLFFILIQQRELRARVVRLFGHHKLAETTRLLDDASQRISRYLFMQSIINGCFGLAIGIGLYLLGVPFALALGFFAGALRFVPYVGAWIAALMPILLSLAVFDGWTRPLLIAALFAVTEVAIAFILEPLLFGRSAGVSALALLVAAAFWTWLWGPIGLMLSTPLTVVLVVFARAVDGLEFIEILLSDNSGTKPSVIFYQRLLAGDEDDAADVVSEAVKSGSLEATLDTVIVPALGRIRLDRLARQLSRAEYRRIVKATRRLAMHHTADPGGGPGGAGEEIAPTTVVAAVPLRDSVDEAGLAMLGQLLAPAGALVRMVPSGLPGVDAVAALEPEGVALICVGAVGPGGARSLCELVRRLHDAAPDTAILVLRCGITGNVGMGRGLRATGASAYATTLAEARDEALRLVARPKELLIPA